MASEVETPPVASLRASTWSTPVVVVGIAFLLLWQSVRSISQETLMSIPPWLLVTLTGIIPQLFLLVYPLVTRRQIPPGRFRLPPVRRLIKEAMIGFGVAIATLVGLMLIHFVVLWLWPTAPLQAKVLERLPRSADTTYVYLFLLAAAVYAPFSEEIFFRGFLFNACCQRMSPVRAGLLSSLIFGFGHFFGLAHAMTTVLTGGVLVIVYRWRQTLITPIFTHMTINTLFAVSMLVAMQAEPKSAILGVFAKYDAEPCRLTAITVGSPAELAGIQIGDTVISCGQYGVKSFEQLQDAVRMYKPGDTIIVQVIRDGELIDYEVTLVSRGALLKR